MLTNHLEFRFSISDLFVFGNNYPAFFTGMFQPFLVWGIRREMVVKTMHDDFHTFILVLTIE